ncbi:MAG: hypothetical protein JWM33_3649 [Caulobacteraceae bacterium]|nr:hypothetical protein [Caulobacteraceae bacterium]
MSPLLSYRSDTTLLLSRLSLGWLTLSSLMVVIVAVPLVEGRNYEPIDPIYYLMLLGPAAGWAAYFRGRLGAVFLLGLPPIVLGMIAIGTDLLPSHGPLT